MLLAPSRLLTVARTEALQCKLVTSTFNDATVWAVDDGGAIGSSVSALQLQAKRVVDWACFARHGDLSPGPNRLGVIWSDLRRPRELSTDVTARPNDHVSHLSRQSGDAEGRSIDDAIRVTLRADMRLSSLRTSLDFPEIL
jgi:hypothetical protein